MNDRLREAFDQVQAEEELKEKTRNFLMKKTHGYQKKKTPTGKNIQTYRNMAAVMACFIFLFLGLGGYRLYFTPTSSISIDINPSMELGINRFDKVISAKAYNEDGRSILDAVNVKYSNYKDAVETILKEKQIAEYLAQDEIMSISVAGTDEEKSREILTAMEECTQKEKNVHCYEGNYETVEEAHKAGLSVGKYHAFQELQELAPDITAEEVQGLTMREIRDKINELSGCEETESDCVQESCEETESDCVQEAYEETESDCVQESYEEAESDCAQESYHKSESQKNAGHHKEYRGKHGGRHE